jgi:putative toxin-antitoxin system antitoxin component (TIGR02293 family)
MSIAEIVEVLGGKKAFRHPISVPEDLASSIREGFPVTTIHSLSERLTLNKAEVARRLGIAPRTLTRRTTRHQRLTADESDRAARMARIIALATEVLGAEEKAASWLRTPNRALNGQLPIDVIETDPGYRQVEEVLYAIAYGMYS